jgi:hypothetical protein
MIGLFFKDLYVIKKQLKIVLIFLLLNAVLAYVGDNTSMFLYIAIMFGFFFPLTTIAYDDRCEWNKLALTMPICVSSLVKSKYLLGALGISIGALSYLLLSLVITSKVDLESLQAALGATSFGILLLSIYLPVCFKFGVEKSRFIIIAISILPSALITILTKGGYIKEPTKDQINLLISLAPFIAVCLFVLSLAISIAIMKRKEY